MPLTWNEIRTRAHAFVAEWDGETREDAESKSFWDAFFNVFGITRRRVAVFEGHVKKLSGATGFIDLFWPGTLVVEHKSAGMSLDKAYEQTLDYFPGISELEMPRYILVSDFARFRLYDLEERTDHEITLAELPSNLELFGFMAGYEKRTYDTQDPVNVQAADRMGKLYDAFLNAGYDGHDLQVYLVRLLFCLYADDTGIFNPRGSFEDFVERSRQDGADLGPLLAQLFEVLNTPPERRQSTLDERFDSFPYVNGQLFAERLRMPAFDSAMRTQLLNACYLDWGNISPAIFGSLFQSVMDPVARRNLGAHYTSEENILKLIGPLFLDDLRTQFEKIRGNERGLKAFHDHLASITFLDPACGCGNFLVVAYRELRRLELDVIREIQRGQQVLNINELLRVNVEQTFGIEIEEFPAQIAQVAMWLVDHQMNLETAAAFGNYFTRLPLVQSARILHANALQVDWATAFEEDQPRAFDFILGNPPFGGKKEQSPEQKADLRKALVGIRGSGVLDFVTGWFILAARYMKAHPGTRTGLVSTNSISQGEQVGILWNELFSSYGVNIHFAHRTFQWKNEAPGKAAVHVVIIGFGPQQVKTKHLFDYEDVRGEPHESIVPNINPYLVAAANVVVLKRREPISSDALPIREGSALIDFGLLILTLEEAETIRNTCSIADKWIRPFFNGEDLINGFARYCLWLHGATPFELRQCRPVMERVQQIQKLRSQSNRAATQRLAATPALFGEIRQPTKRYLFIPKTSSENRTYVPMTFLEPRVILNNTSLYIDGADLYHFGMISSAMHMAWVRYTAGRMKSDYRYSNSIVYNNFPWPENPSESRRKAVEEAAEAVLNAREPHLESGATLADLYDPLTMPPDLHRTHVRLDRAVDRAYRSQPFDNEAQRVAFLFDRYEALVNALFQ